MRLAAAAVLVVLIASACSDREPPALTGGALTAVSGPGTGPVSVNSAPNKGKSSLENLQLPRDESGHATIAFQFNGGLPAAEIEYVEEVVDCRTGVRLSRRGSGHLLVRFDELLNPKQIGGLVANSLEMFSAYGFQGEAAWAVRVSSQSAFSVSTGTDPWRLLIQIEQ